MTLYEKEYFLILEEVRINLEENFLYQIRFSL